MDLATQTHLAAGLGAAALAVAVLPGRRIPRNALFALLCGALSVWNLGVAGKGAGIAPEFPWHLLYLFGSCAAAPLGLHFILALTRAPRAVYRTCLPPGYAISLLLWAGLFLRDPHSGTWNLFAIPLLGASLFTALGVLAWRFVTTPPGPERSAWRLLLIGCAVTVVAALSDFVPRHGADQPRSGPVAILCLLTLLCAVIARHRFLDVNRYLVRGFALVLGAGASTLLLAAIAGTPAERILPLFLGTLAVLATAVWGVRALVSGARGLLGGEDATLAALGRIARELPTDEGGSVWGAIETGLAGPSGGASLLVCVEERGVYRRVWPPGGETLEVAASEPLVRFLRETRATVTRRILEDEALDGAGKRAAIAARALERLPETGGDGLIVPLLGEEGLAGWAVLTGGKPQAYLTARAALALSAVAHQALAGIERARAVEESRRRKTLAAVGEMAAGLAHEVRNPLGTIHGAVQVIETDPSGSRQREMLEIIREETGRLGRVVGEFLDYARPDAVPRGDLDLNELVRSVLRSAQTGAATARVVVEAKPAGAVVRGNPDQLFRALLNVVRNGLEAAGPEGTVTVRTWEEGPAFAISVEDDGPGIPEEEVARLCQPFHTTKPGGTGLGLALTHRILEAHGGALRVERRAGGGSVFTLLLPRAPVTRGAPGDPALRTASGGGPGGHR